MRGAPATIARMTDYPLQPDEASLEELLELARQLGAHPENRHGADKSWVLGFQRRYRALVSSLRAQNPDGPRHHGFDPSSGAAGAVARNTALLSPTSVVGTSLDGDDNVDEWIRACVALQRAGVRFLVVGAFGAQLHFLFSANRIATADIDLLLPRDADEVLRALLALRDAGFALESGGEELIPDEVIAAGIVRQAASIRAIRQEEWVDLMTWARGMDFDELWPRRQSFGMCGVPLDAAPLAAILRSKREAFRLKDRLFLERFRESITEALDRERRRESGRPPVPPTAG